jgi:hypothetical protein
VFYPREVAGLMMMMMMMMITIIIIIIIIKGPITFLMGVLRLSRL